MKQVWQFDQETGYVLAPIMVADEMEINANFQTLVKPPENVSVKFDKNVGKWVEFTPTVEMTDVQKILMNQATQIAGMQKLIMSQASELAEMKKGSNE